LESKHVIVITIMMQLELS